MSFRGMERDEGSRDSRDRDSRGPSASLKPTSFAQSFALTANGNRLSSLDVLTSQKTVMTCKDVTTGSGRNRKTTKVCTDSVSTFSQTGGTAYAQGKANQYSRPDKVDGNAVSSGSALRWDKNGNLTEDATFAYRYDWQNRLALVTKKIAVLSPRRGARGDGRDHDEGRFSEFVIASPEGARQSMPSGDSSGDDESSASSEDDDVSTIEEPVFAPYAETPVAAWRYDALGRRVQTVADPSFQAPDKRSARRWVPGDANANGTLAQAPALAGGSVTFAVFAGQNDVAKLDSQGKPLAETAYRDPLSYDAPVAYFRLTKQLVWVAKNGKEIVLSSDEDRSDADGRGGHEGLSRLASKFGRGGKLQIRESWKIYAYHLDRLGSVVAISDSQGKILEQYRYDPFGKPYVLASALSSFPLTRGTEGVSSSRDEGSRRTAAAYVWRPLSRPGLGNSKLYTGRDYDSATKTYWYRARTFSPSLGRFFQRDPLGYADGANPYAYVGNGPWGATDPLGLSSKFALGGVWRDFSSGVSDNLRNVAGRLGHIAGTAWNGAAGLGQCLTEDPDCDMKIIGGAYQALARAGACLSEDPDCDVHALESLLYLGEEYPAGREGQLSDANAALMLLGTAGLGAQARGLGGTSVANTESSLVRSSLVPRFNSNSLAMGLENGLNEFASRVGAPSYKTFGSEFRMFPDQSLAEKLFAKMQSVERIHFNLDGFRRVEYSKFLENPFIGKDNITNWELFSISNTPELLGKTIFYEGFQPVPMPKWIKSIY